MEKAKIFAMLFPLGTLESTSSTGWTWTLIAHLDMVKQAGVEFDPEARTLTSVQGIASSGSALQVRMPTLAYHCTVNTFALPAPHHLHIPDSRCDASSPKNNQDPVLVSCGAW